MAAHRFAAITGAIVNALAAAGRAVRFSRRPHQSPIARASYELLRIQDQADRKGYGPDPEHWPRRMANRYYQLWNDIKNYRYNP
jgi:hypothetical protein